MKDEFDRNKHFEQHKKRITKIKKEIHERKIIERLKEKIRQRRESKNE